MDSMHALARQAMADLPPATRFTAYDGDVIARHRDLLHSWGPQIVQGFYDTLYGHDTTAQVFNPDERPHREATLAHWWARTVDEPVDEDYFAWMVMVGLVHVLRRVSNPMMLSMASFVVDFVVDHADQAGLAPDAAEELIGAFRRLASTVGSIITFGYDQAMASALFNIAGMPDALLRRLRDHEVADALAEARAELAAG